MKRRNFISNMMLAGGSLALGGCSSEKKEFEIRNDRIESSGCPFAPRCPFRKDRCLNERCNVRETAAGHYVSCFLTEE